MKKLANIELKHIFFFDIETSSVVPSLEKDTPLYDSFEYSFKRDLQEGETLESHFSSRAALYPEFGRIVCLTMGRFYNEQIVVKTFNNLDEAALLQEVNDYMFGYATNMTRLAGHACIPFDIPYVAKRMFIHGIVPHDLFDVFGKKPWDLDKTVIDTKYLWQATSQRPMSLINIAVAMGIPSPKDDISGAEVPALFWENPEGNIDRISRYCEKDVATVGQILLHLKGQGQWPVVSASDMEVRQLSVLEKLSKGAPIKKEELTGLATAISLFSENKRKTGIAQDILKSLAINNETSELTTLIQSLNDTTKN